MIELLVLGVTTVAAVAGYVKSRSYVRDRLRFVDVVQRPGTALLAGAVAALAAGPVVWLLPFIGAPSAIVFGIGVGAGVAHGARDVRRLPGA